MTRNPAPARPTNQNSTRTKQVPAGTTIGAKVSRSGSTVQPHQRTKLVGKGATKMTGKFGQGPAAPRGR